MSETKERPILFSAPMVRAILEGRKTQTRRIVKPPKTEPVLHNPSDFSRWERGDGHDVAHVWFERGNHTAWVDCPYGKPGDLLWVRETWGRNPDDQGAIYRATDPDWDVEETCLKWKPSIHMPRWASRLLLRITDVRVEQVQDLGESDAFWEGVMYPDPPANLSDGEKLQWLSSAIVDEYGNLWDSINGNKPGASWANNPWVWVVEFERVEGGNL